MVAVYRIQAVIYKAERLNNTKSGNPHYLFHTSQGPLYMEMDADLGYTVANLLYDPYDERRQDSKRHIIGNPECPKVTLLATPQRRVYGIEVDSKELRA